MLDRTNAQTGFCSRAAPSSPTASARSAALPRGQPHRARRQSCRHRRPEHRALRRMGRRPARQPDRRGAALRDRPARFPATYRRCCRATRAAISRTTCRSAAPTPCPRSSSIWNTISTRQASRRRTGTTGSPSARRMRGLRRSPARSGTSVTTRRPAGADRHPQRVSARRLAGRLHSQARAHRLHQRRSPRWLERDADHRRLLPLQRLDGRRHRRSRLGRQSQRFRQPAASGQRHRQARALFLRLNPGGHRCQCFSSSSPTRRGGCSCSSPSSSGSAFRRCGRAPSPCAVSSSRPRSSSPGAWSG